MHEFHARAVTILPNGFEELAKDGQILLSDTNKVLTFQGHPEMSEELAVSLLEKDSDYVEGMSLKRRKEVVESARKRHDGFAIWERIVKWIHE